MKKLNSLIAYRSSRGFTLIELMVVITIIAILALAGIVIYSNVQKSSREARRKADVDSIAQAMEVNYNSNEGTYPQLVGSFFSAGVVPKDPKNQDYIGVASPATATGTVTYAALAASGTKTVWKVCADLEADGLGTTLDTTASPTGGAVNEDYCKVNAQ